MRVLLIQPPIEDFYQTTIRTQPLGLASLAASLRAQGHEPAILDCQAPGKKRNLPLPTAFSYLKRFYAEGDISPFRLFGRYSHFGLSWEEIRDRITAERPQAVGISCQFTPYVGETMETARLVKVFSPGIPVIVGGAHATACPGEVLKSPFIDYVVLGEGERIVSALISALAEGSSCRGLQGIAYKQEGEAIINPRPGFEDYLDTLPLPARDLLDRSWYAVGRDPCAMLLTSRGCSQRCSYCSVHQVMGGRIRCRSAEHVIAEIKACHELYGITAFDFEDDNFTFDKSRAMKILGGIVQNFGERRLRLFAMNGLSLFSLDRELLQAMRDAGFERLDVSLGSSSPELNRDMDRPADLERADAALEAAAELCLSVTAYIILGMPDHRLEAMLDSMLYLMARPCMIGPSIFYPSPGTRTYDSVKAAGLCDLSKFAQLRSSAFPVETPHCSRLDLVTLLRLCRWINFIKGLLARESTSTEFPQLQKFLSGAPDISACRSKPLRPEDAGLLLSDRLMREGLFYGIRRERSEKNIFKYALFPHETSVKAVALFFEKAQSIRVRPPAAVT